MKEYHKIIQNLDILDELKNTQLPLVASRHQLQAGQLCGLMMREDSWRELYRDDDSPSRDIKRISPLTAGFFYDS